MKKYVLTKDDIACMASDIARALEEMGLAGDTRIYYNNKCIDFDSGEFADIEHDDYSIVYDITYIEDINPQDYFWTPDNHILSMSFEGPLYDFLYEGGLPKKLQKIFKAYHVYYEQYNAWNLSLYPEDDIEVEYTVYSKPPKPEAMYIFLGCRERMGKEYPEELDDIMNLWYILGGLHVKANGQRGCCVLGEHMEFIYKGVLYHMAPMTGYLGEDSWIPFVPVIKAYLKNIGATNISWDAGILD